MNNEQENDDKEVDDKEVDKTNGAETRIVWKRPHPNSALTLAINAMEHAGDSILATALRRLTLAEANGGVGGSAMLEYRDIREWLETVKTDIDWLLAHIHDDGFSLDLQTEVSQNRQAKQCEWCGEWFLPVRSTGKYCRPSHKIRAQEDRDRRNAKGSSA